MKIKPYLPVTCTCCQWKSQAYLEVSFKLHAESFCQARAWRLRNVRNELAAMGIPATFSSKANATVIIRAHQCTHPATSNKASTHVLCTFFGSCTTYVIYGENVYLPTPSFDAWCQYASELATEISWWHFLNSRITLCICTRMFIFHLVLFQMEVTEGI